MIIAIKIKLIKHAMDLFLKQIDIDIVVAESLHLCEFHDSSSDAFSPSAAWASSSSSSFFSAG